MPGDIAHWRAEFSLGMEILRHVYMLSSSSELRIPMWIKVQSFLDWLGCDFANLNIVSHLDICFQVNIIQRESYWKRGNYFPVRWNSAAQSRWRLRTSPFLLSLLCDLGQFLWPHWTSGENELQQMLLGISSTLPESLMAQTVYYSRKWFLIVEKRTQQYEVITACLTGVKLSKYWYCQLHRGQGHWVN